MAVQQSNGIHLGQNPHLNVLIIAGGSGTRFWPRSRQGKPKQLLKFWDERTLLEHTVDRFLGSAGLEGRTWIVTTQALVDGSQKALGESIAEKVHFLGEPQGRNTAPCILWGLREIAKKDPEAIVCIVPADHYIGNVPGFQSALMQAAEAAVKTKGIVTLGIKPNRPETGYGYIEVGGSTGVGVSAVSKFVEKPALRDALRYVGSGNYLWNAGIFIVQAAVGLEAFERCMPNLGKVFAQEAEIEKIYQSIDPLDAVSIDYGVMEIAQEKGIPVSVIPVEFDWNDLGSYTALEEIDKAVKGTVVSHNAASNIVQSDRGLVALLGVNDLIVVREGDIVLVASKDRCQDIRKLVERVKKDHPEMA